MGFWGIFAIAVGLSMDAFAVSVSKGLATPRYQARQSLICGLWFGGFQMLMPLIGCFLGTQFAGYIQAIDHWIAFVLLALIGGNMIREAVRGEEEEADSSYAPSRMLPLAIATAIDALAIGVTFAFLRVNIWTAVLEIGVTTFVFSAAGVRIGSVFGEKYAARAEIAGGAILVLMGLRILLEHLGIF
ncbi:MAG: manganese efflux pump MntP family protein [Butyricicoccus sp.]|nr:manganese efflux pump MntP family protein [Butyricicoccus sp.]